MSQALVKIRDSVHLRMCTRFQIEVLDIDLRKAFYSFTEPTPQKAPVLLGCKLCHKMRNSLLWENGVVDGLSLNLDNISSCEVSGIR